jgi:hypothetical protein
MQQTTFQYLTQNNATINDYKLDSNYFLFIEGLTELGCSTDNINKIDHILVEIIDSSTDDIVDSFITTLFEPLEETIKFAKTLLKEQ